MAPGTPIQPDPNKTLEDFAIEDHILSMDLQANDLTLINTQPEHRSRELSLAITNLEQASMWLKEHAVRHAHQVTD